MFVVGSNNLKRARSFAAKAHISQMYGDFPYTKHLDDVDNVLVRFGYFHEWDLRITGQLHDSVEDNTDVSIMTIAAEFGEGVANLVNATTDGDGKNRKERKAAAYEKLKKNRRAIIVKLADRIANVEWSLLTNLSLLKMYVKERDAFWGNLYDRVDGEQVYNMWKHLDYLMVLGMFALNMNRSVE